LLGAKSTPTLLTCLTMQAIALANGDWSTCHSRHLTTAVWKSTMRDKLKNNINHIIQHQNSQVISKNFAGKKQNAKSYKVFKTFSISRIRIRLEQKWYPIRLRVQKNLIILPDQTPKIRTRNNTAMFSVYTKRRESKAKTFPTFKLSTKCRDIGKARRRLSLRFGSTLNVGK